ncbi:MAG: hypothetical protein WCZ00_03595 [Acholeplasmataceae bacterium]
MKYKIMIKNENQIIFDGRPLDLPIKKDILISKSVEMFNDEDPCIIHQTYVIETLVDQLISKLKKQINEEVSIIDIKESVRFIDIDQLETYKIILRSK